MPEAMKRVEAVRKLRQASKSEPTRKIAATPTRFHVENMPESGFLVIPEVSSERRKYIPIGFLSPSVFASNKLRIFPNATLYHFGVLSSDMHMAWMRYTTGRLKSDFRYSVTVVYNNFPWPQKLEDKHRDVIEVAVHGVFDARTAHAGATLAQLYDPNTMPPNLVKAHQSLDRAVDAAYVPDGGSRKYTCDAERVAFLFRRYADLTSLLA